MACDLDTLISQSCASGIGKVQDPIQLLQLIAQLTCEAAQGVNGGAPLEKESFVAPAMPFVYVASLRTELEVNYTLDVTGAFNAQITITRASLPDMFVTAQSAGGDAERLFSILLAPGDTVTISDTSDAPSSASLLSVVAIIG